MQIRSRFDDSLSLEEESKVLRGLYDINRSSFIQNSIRTFARSLALANDENLIDGRSMSSRFFEVPLRSSCPQRILPKMTKSLHHTCRFTFAMTQAVSAFALVAGICSRNSPPTTFECLLSPPEKNFSTTMTFLSQTSINEEQTPKRWRLFWHWVTSHRNHLNCWSHFIIFWMLRTRANRERFDHASRLTFAVRSECALHCN